MARVHRLFIVEVGSFDEEHLPDSDTLRELLVGPTEDESGEPIFAGRPWYVQDVVFDEEFDADRMYGLEPVDLFDDEGDWIE